MDVNQLVTRLTEPASTGQVRALIAGARTRLTPAQVETMMRWEENRPIVPGVLRDLQASTELATLHHAITELARVRPRSHPAPTSDDRLAQLTPLLVHAAARPAVVSALVWHWLGERDEDLASHVIQVVRERAGLPGLRRRIAGGEPEGESTDASLPARVTWFGDRQAEDACTWIEHVPAPEGGTLSTAVATIEAARAAAPRIAVETIAAFVRRAAAFLLHLSQRELDPLGFPLGRDAHLDLDPSHDRRLALTQWAKSAGHAICPRGRMVVLSVPVTAPWPFAVELVAVELGHGACGGLGLLLRLAGELPTLTTTSVPAPVLLCVPSETPEERGPRFERWLSRAYPHATQTWRGWL